jgi:hypothetical protein
MLHLDCIHEHGSFPMSRYMCGGGEDSREESEKKYGRNQTKDLGAPGERGGIYSLSPPPRAQTIITTTILIITAPCHVQPYIPPSLSPPVMLDVTARDEDDLVPITPSPSFAHPSPL